LHYIIDGYNFLFSLKSQITNLESDREDLLHLLETLLEGLNSSIVFDSSFPNAENYPSKVFHNGLEIIYAPEGQTADECIIELISYKKNRSDLMVITSDTHLARHVQALSCRSESIPAFLDRLLLRQRKLRRRGKPPLIATSYEINRLTEIFEKKLQEPSNNEWLIDPGKPPL
jgi:predicted RNA-binding protein with PIN domain